MTKKDIKKKRSGFSVETTPVGLFPAGSILCVSGNKVVTRPECRSDRAEGEADEIAKTRKGIEKYLQIMERVWKTDVAKDESFQRQYNGFYQVRRNAAWRRFYYSYMEESKGKELDVTAVMIDFYKRAPGKRLELSFVSKLMHTLDPTFPIYDKKIAQFMDFELPKPYRSFEERLALLGENYSTLQNYYRSGAADAHVALFEKLFPEYKDRVGYVKKADFIVWRDLDKSSDE